MLSFIEKKGPSGYKKFLEALKDEPSHLGHKEVVRILTTRTQGNHYNYNYFSITDTILFHYRINDFSVEVTFSLYMH